LSNFTVAQGKGYLAHLTPTDWIVTTNVIVINKTLILDGDLIVEEGGSLTFRNVTLIMNKTKSSILVKSGGSFYIYDYDDKHITTYDSSLITAGESKYYKIEISSGANFKLKNSKISKCGWYDFASDSYYGFVIRADNTIIENSEISESAQYIWGVCIFSAYNVIANSTISNNNADGIELKAGAHNNTIINSTISSNSRYGVYLHGTYLSKTLDNTIKNCTINSNSAGIYLLYASRTKIENSTISNNAGHGVYLWSSSNNTIKNCKIIYNNGWQSSYYYGVSLRYRSNDNLITWNNISFNYNYNIYLTDSVRNTIFHNNFYKQDNQAYDNNVTDANSWDNGIEGNYWSDYIEDSGTYPIDGGTAKDNFPQASPYEDVP
jgi:parallel beta-helix repeat protein